MPSLIFKKGLDLKHEVVGQLAASYHSPLVAAIKANGIAIWLRAELPLLMRRVMRRSNRPLLQAEDPQAVMQALMDKRYPVYAEADLTIESKDVPHDAMVDEILRALKTSGLLDAPNVLDPADGGETSTIEGKEPA